MSPPPSSSAEIDSKSDVPVGPHGRPLGFEEALAELEAVVDRMERGDLSLETSLADYERGMRLHRYCQIMLSRAQQKVEVLVRRVESPEPGDLSPFESDRAGGNTADPSRNGPVPHTEEHGDGRS